MASAAAFGAWLTRSRQPLSKDVQRRFAFRHPWDRIAFPVFVGLIWIVILLGFVPEVIDQLRKNEFDYPVVTHVHALTFTAWLILLTVQTALVRSGKVRLHRRLGIAGACLVPLMVVLGVTVSVVMFRREYSPEFLPLNLSLRIGDMLNFGTVAAAGLALRKRDPSAHKRLILLATFCLAAAGFGRWWGDALLSDFGSVFLGRWSFDYLGVLILIIVLGSYDLITRHRLNKAFAWASVGVVSVQLLAVLVRDSGWWRPLSMTLIGL
jgi:uncharacterized membrane protein YozB (DUF420 family)